MDEILECVSPDISPEELLRLRREVRKRAGVFSRLAERHALLASDTRLKILSLLGCAKELCVCDIATVLELTPAAVSQHLSRLRAGDMVHPRRDGMTIYYALVHAGWTPVSPPPRIAQLDVDPPQDADGEADDESDRNAPADD